MSEGHELSDQQVDAEFRQITNQIPDVDQEVIDEAVQAALRTFAAVDQRKNENLDHANQAEIDKHFPSKL